MKGPKMSYVMGRITLYGRALYRVSSVLCDFASWYRISGGNRSQLYAGRQDKRCVLICQHQLHFHVYFFLYTSSTAIALNNPLIPLFTHHSSFFLWLFEQTGKLWRRRPFISLYFSYLSPHSPLETMHKKSRFPKHLGSSSPVWRDSLSDGNWIVVQHLGWSLATSLLRGFQLILKVNIDSWSQSVFS